MKEKGFQYQDEGLELIKLILSQMNNNRLSTRNTTQKVDRNELYLKINELLNRPSNYDNRNGRRFILSLNRFDNLGKNIGVEVINSLAQAVGWLFFVGSLGQSVPNFYQCRSEQLEEG